MSGDRLTLMSFCGIVRVLARIGGRLGVIRVGARA